MPDVETSWSLVKQVGKVRGLMDAESRSGQPMIIFEPELSAETFKRQCQHTMTIILGFRSVACGPLLHFITIVNVDLRVSGREWLAGLPWFTDD